MSRILDLLSQLVTARPIVTLIVLLALTIGLGAGITLLAPLADEAVFLPEDSKVSTASGKIEVLFGGTKDTVAATLIFRGDTLTPAGLAQIDSVLKEASSDPRVAPLLAQSDPVIAPTMLIAAALGTSDFSSLSQEQIDQAATLVPIDRLVGVDVEGSPVAVANVRLTKDIDGDGDVEDDAETLAEGEIALRDIAAGSQGPLDGTSLSTAVISGGTSDASSSEMILLMGLALAVIAGLLLVFTRSLPDLILCVLGLCITIVWTLGAQGWLGPNGLGVIGAPNILTTMVPVMLIGLVVDYAIQTVGLYREQRHVGHDVRTSARLGLRAVIVPLSLAAITTIVSFMTNVTSPIPANGDLGVVAGVGVGAGLIVMLSLLASSRVLLDRWRESRGSLPGARPISGAIPGLDRAAEALGGLLVRRPTPFLVAIGAVTLVLGIAATRLDTVFDINDFLPSDGAVARDIKTLEAAFGGSTEVVKVLVEAEITDDRTVRNLLDLGEAFSDDLRRPEGVVSGIQSSVGVLLLDWVTDGGTSDGKYDAELRAMSQAANEFRLDPARIQAIIDRLEELDPEGFGQVAVDNPNGPDTLLIQFQALTGDQDRAGRMVEDINGLWFGDEDELTVTSAQVVGLEVLNAMTGSQTASIAVTALAALIILSIFFWVTEGRPALGFIAVGPIVMVLFWVLGTMTLLGIPYNVITALITALSIGIGVDYTIHIVHRYEEEFAHTGEPETAARRTLATTGSALLGSALTTALGFGVLTLSSRIPLQQFGTLTAITISYALIAAIVVVPPLMVMWAAYQKHRMQSAAARAE